MASNILWNTRTRIAVPFSGNGLNSLPNNGFIGSSGIDTERTDLSILAEVEATVVYGTDTAPALNSSITVWFLRSLDDSTWETAAESGNFTPARAPDVVLPLMAFTGLQRVTQLAVLPPGNFKAWVKNDATGATTAEASGNIFIRPLTYQIV